tara:strand:+ start:368 stop:592 length:225 start_codon:yes stop_codon:yes gene_type:complete
MKTTTKYPMIIQIEKWKGMDYIISKRTKRINNQEEFEEMRKGLKQNEFWQEQKTNRTFLEPLQEKKVWKTNFQI